MSLRHTNIHINIFFAFKKNFNRHVGVSTDVGVYILGVCCYKFYNQNQTNQTCSVVAILTNPLAV